MHSTINPTAKHTKQKKLPRFARLLRTLVREARWSYSTAPNRVHAFKEMRKQQLDFGGHFDLTCRVCVCVCDFFQLSRLFAPEAVYHVTTRTATVATPAEVTSDVARAPTLPRGRWKNWNKHFLAATTRMSSCGKCWPENSTSPNPAFRSVLRGFGPPCKGTKG